MKFWSLFLFSLLFYSSCLPGTTGDLIFREQNFIPFEQEPEEVTFRLVTEKIFEQKCLSCHKTDRDLGGVDLSRYDALFGYSDYFQPIVTPNDPDNSGLYTEVASGSMPPRNPLNEEEIELIRRWIESGAAQ